MTVLPQERYCIVRSMNFLISNKNSVININTEKYRDWFHAFLFSIPIYRFVFYYGCVSQGTIGMDCWSNGYTILWESILL